MNGWHNGFPGPGAWQGRSAGGVETTRGRAVDALVAAGWDPARAEALAASWVALSADEFGARLADAVAHPPARQHRRYVAPGGGSTGDTDDAPETHDDAPPEEHPAEEHDDAPPTTTPLTEAELRALARLGVTADDWTAWRSQGTDRPKLAMAVLNHVSTTLTPGDVLGAVITWPDGELLARAVQYIDAHPREGAPPPPPPAPPTYREDVGGAYGETRSRKKTSGGAKALFAAVLAKLLLG